MFLGSPHCQNLKFGPAKLQPFKLDLELSSFEDRIEMIRLAIRKEAFMFTSELENELLGLSFQALLCCVWTMFL